MTKVSWYKHFGRGTEQTDFLIARKGLRARATLGDRKRGETPAGAAAFIARFMAEVIHVVAGLFCKEQRKRERKKEWGRKETERNAFPK